MKSTKPVIVLMVAVMRNRMESVVYFVHLVKRTSNYTHLNVFKLVNVFKMSAFCG